MHLFEDANLCAIHAKRVTIMVKDIQVCFVLLVLVGRFDSCRFALTPAAWQGTSHT